MNNPVQQEPVDIIASAMEYIDLGYVVFPVYLFKKEGDAKVTKLPLIKAWQKLSYNKENLLHNFEQHKGKANGIGLPTGRVNKVFVLDVDLGADIKGKELPPTPCATTLSGGRHFYYEYEPYGNTVNKEKNLDTRCEGGFVVLPPSSYGNASYEWNLSLTDVSMATIPQWIKQELLGLGERKTVFKMSGGVGNGERNNSAASVIGHVLKRLDESLWHDFAWVGFVEWNKRNTPPMSKDELKKVFISIASREKMRREAYKG